MAARTSAYETSRKDGIIQSIPMIANETIYKGSTVVIATATGLAFTNDGTTNTLSAGDIFGGICVETTTSTTSAETYVNVYRSGIFQLSVSDTLTQANVGDKVYINNTSDDGAVTITVDGGVDLYIGNIVEFVSANLAYVSIDGRAGVEIAA